MKNSIIIIFLICGILSGCIENNSNPILENALLPSPTITSYLMPMEEVKYIFKEEKSGKIDSFFINKIQSQYSEKYGNKAIFVSFKLSNDSVYLFSEGSAQSDIDKYNFSGIGSFQNTNTKSTIIFSINNKGKYKIRTLNNTNTEDSICYSDSFLSYKNILTLYSPKNVNIYFAKEIGIIRIEYLKENQVWNLVKYEETNPTDLRKLKL